jgi:preprotein translocase subunit YajC
VTFTHLLLAQAGADPKMTLLFIGALFAIMYFVMIRPQQRQLKQQREMLTGLKKGDEVITNSGIIGRVHAVMEKEIQLEISNGVKVRMLKSVVQGKVALADDKKDAAADDKKEDSKEAK